MIEKRLQDIWGQLQGKKPHMSHFLDEIQLQGIRGIDDLTIRLDYPVSVIAGRNASGKSTVLFAASCAYQEVGGIDNYTPQNTFLDYHPIEGKYSDPWDEVNIVYRYDALGDPVSMVWQRVKEGEWRKILGNPEHGKQPERHVYLRTLNSIGDPFDRDGIHEVRTNQQEKKLTPDQITFAWNILSFNYHEVVDLSDRKKSLLFAANENGSSYSELHMAAGERAILRLAQRVAQMKNALILIDEVETSLHPFVQQLLMLHLQQLALDNDLQIIVTSHSSVVLDSVPVQGRIFLDRDSQGKVKILTPYRDIIQKALYGRYHDVLNLLCEDEAAEGILRGVLGTIFHDREINHDLVRIGRDTGAGEFPKHATAFRKAGIIDKFVFILDGDQKGGDIPRKIRKHAKDPSLNILFLPGNYAPEVWIWERLEENPSCWASRLGIDESYLCDKMAGVNDIKDAKGKINKLVSYVPKLSVISLCHIIAKWESEDDSSAIQTLVKELEQILTNWRSS